MLLVIVLLVGGAITVYTLWTGRPAGWNEIDQYLASQTPEQLAADAVALENRLPSEWTSRRGTPTAPAERTIRIEEAEANAWLQHRVRGWARSAGVEIPSQVGQAAVWTEDDNIVLAVKIDVEGFSQVIGATISLNVTPDGAMTAKVASVQAGRLPMPTQTLIEQSGITSHPDFEQVAPWIDKAINGMSFEPVHPVDETRQVRVLGVEVQDDAVEILVRTEPRGGSE